jgi:N-acetylglutamate synthase-like GNAT family acetyltransferase
MSGAQTKLLHIQQFGLNPVTQHKLLVARKLVQLRDQINQQVLQTRQNVVAFRYAIFLKKSTDARAFKRVNKK